MRGHPLIQKRLEKLQQSLWLRPLLMMLLGVTLGIGLPLLEVRHIEWGGVREIAWFTIFLQASADATRDVMLAGMGALATILAVGFTMTMVTVQLAASQYSSRLLRNFLGDRVTQWALGLFLGTITYLLLVLRVVESVGDDVDGFTPVLAVMLGTLLVVGCLAFMAFFLHHMARSVNAATLVSRVGKEALSTLESLHPRAGARPDSRADGAGASSEPVGPSRVVRSEKTGYVLQIDRHLLCRALGDRAQTVRVEVRPGDFLIPGQALVRLWPSVELDAQARRALHEALPTSTERSTRHDVLYCVRQLVDVASKALSPSIHDATTAYQVVNELALLTRATALSCGAGGGLREEHVDGVRLLMPAFGLRELLPEAFGELPRFAADQPRIIARLLEVFAGIARQAEDADAREVIELCGRQFLEAVERVDLRAVERGAIDDRWLALRAATRGEAPRDGSRSPGEPADAIH